MGGAGQARISGRVVSRVGMLLTSDEAKELARRASEEALLLGLFLGVIIGGVVTLLLIRILR